MAKRSGVEKAAWITAGSIIVVAIIYVFGAPLFGDRPIAQVSFGLEKDYPLDTLQSEGDYYSIRTYWSNTGESAVFSMLSYTGTNVKLSSNENGPWDYKISPKYMLEPSDKLIQTTIFVSPDPGVNQFKIEFDTKVHPEQNPFQKLTPLIPTMLTYEKSGNDYILIDAR